MKRKILLKMMCFMTLFCCIGMNTAYAAASNEVEFQLKGGEQVTFNDIPSGTTYQVWEETPDGWVLMSQENASGTIQSMQNSTVQFKNQYQPGKTSIQFTGLKLLDDQAADAGSFQFVLKEGTTVLETVSVSEGGLIQFPVITFDEVGEHVYTISEVIHYNNGISYDMHEETINVAITSDGNNGLVNSVTYDNDGIVFRNKTQSGMLKLTKNVNNTSEANKNDVFNFEIEFYDENGMPLSGDFFYYYEGETPTQIATRKAAFAQKKAKEVLANLSN